MHIVIVRERRQTKQESLWLPLALCHSYYSADRLFRASVEGGAWSAIVHLEYGEDGALVVRACHQSGGAPVAVLWQLTKQREQTLQVAIADALAGILAQGESCYATVDG